MKLNPGPCTGALGSSRVMPSPNTDRNEGLLEKPRLSVTRLQGVYYTVPEMKWKLCIVRVPQTSRIIGDASSI
jgi:hypothetical protein